MAIPNNISRKHIFQAMIKTNREGIPPNRNTTEWALEYEDETFPQPAQ